MESLDEEVLDHEDGQSMMVFEGMLEVVECPEQVHKKRINCSVFLFISVTMIPSCYPLPPLLLPVLSMGVADNLAGVGDRTDGGPGYGRGSVAGAAG